MCPSDEKSHKKVHKLRAYICCKCQITSHLVFMLIVTDDLLLRVKILCAYYSMVNVWNRENNIMGFCIT